MGICSIYGIRFSKKISPEELPSVHPFVTLFFEHSDTFSFHQTRIILWKTISVITLTTSPPSVSPPPTPIIRMRTDFELFRRAFFLPLIVFWDRILVRVFRYYLRGTFFSIKKEMKRRLKCNFRHRSSGLTVRLATYAFFSTEEKIHRR